MQRSGERHMNDRSNADARPDHGEIGGSQMTIALPFSASPLDTFLRFLPDSVRALVEQPLRRPSLPLTLAWSETVQSYRRSLLGPLWITLNLLIFTFSMTLVYGALFSVPTMEYAGFLTCGMIVWFWVLALLNEVGNTFINYGHFVKNTPIDKAILIWATVYKQVIVLGHHLIAYAGLVAFGLIDLTFYTLLAIPAFIILFLMSVPITAVMAIHFPRFRDLSRLITSFMLVLLMVTPIFWHPSMLKGWRRLIIDFNPIYYMVELVRSPLLGKPIEPVVALAALGMTLVFWAIGAFAYRRYGKYVVFWL